MGDLFMAVNGVLFHALSQLCQSLAPLPHRQLGPDTEQALGQAAPLLFVRIPVELAGPKQIIVQFVHPLHSFLQASARVTTQQSMACGVSPFLQNLAAPPHQSVQAFAGVDQRLAQGHRAGGDGQPGRRPAALSPAFSSAAAHRR